MGDLMKIFINSRDYEYGNDFEPVMQFLSKTYLETKSLDIANYLNQDWK